MVLPSRLFHVANNLIGYLLHAFNGRMTRNFVDVFQFDEFDAVAVAEGSDGGVDIVLEDVVEHEVDVGTGIVLLHPLQHTRQGGTELPEVGRLDVVAILVFAYRRTCPVVVGCTEDEDDIGIAQIVHAGHERTVRVVGPVTLGLNIHNLLGTKYDRSGMNTSIIPQQGRWFMGSVAIRLR